MIRLALLLLMLAAPAAAEIRVTDLAGREVVLAAPARRIVLAEARHIAVLGMLHDDPVALVAGWRENKTLDEATHAAWRERFPEIDAIRSVGSGNRDLSVETIIALGPDLVILPLADARNDGLSHALDMLDRLGIPMAFVDFFSHPQENTLPSLALIGALTGAEERAEAFAGFYTERLERVRSRLDDPGLIRPTVFFHAHAAASDCCSTVGQGMFHDFIETAGGRNIAQEAVPGVIGKVGLEFVLSRDPEYFIATGGTHLAGRGGLVLGAGVTEDTAEASFAALTGAPGFSGLTAVAEGRAAGVWHMFNDTPAHIVLIEYLAKTLHPERFADIDPAATLAEFQRRFAPVEVPGAYWTAPAP